MNWDLAQMRRQPNWRHFVRLVEAAAEGRPLTLTDEGKAVAVVVSYEDYKRIQEALS